MKIFLALILVLTPALLRAEHDGKIQILLLGDSTTEASFTKKFAPKEPQFEDVIRLLLAAQSDLPPKRTFGELVTARFSRTVTPFTYIVRESS